MTVASQTKQNVDRFSPSRLAAWTGGEWTAEPLQPIQGFCQDTRILQAGEMYIAIRGEHRDGHDFTGHASEIGASAALVSADWPGLATSPIPCLVVPDSRVALQGMAAAYRRTWSGRVVGITGSVGKTTCKELIADLLSTAGTVSRTYRNYNNEIGVPLSLLRAGDQDAFGVFEVAMSHPGEIAPLTRWIRPDVGVLTPVGQAHAAGFADVEAIRREKASLLAEVSEDGFCVLNADVPGFETFVTRCAAPVVTVALQGEADWSGRRDGKQLELFHQGQSVLSCTPQIQAPFMDRNILIAVATAYGLGVSPKAMLEVINHFVPPGMRWKRELWNERTLILDCYNANPLSMEAALDALAQTKCSGRRWAVLGGMLELGDEEEELHRTLGAHLAHQGLCCIGVGERGRWIAEGAEAADADTVYSVKDAQDAVQRLQDQVRSGDVILFKGSRGEQIEQVVTAWKERG